MLWLDLETYCELPISVGTYRYAESCEVDLLAFAFDDDPVTVLDITAGEELPPRLADYLINGDGPITAHNAMFDRTCLRLGNLKLDIPIPRWRCSMVRALAHGLPGGLDKLGEILGVEQDKRKLKTGRDLMMLFCKPRPKNSKIRRATAETHPREREQYIAYAGNDIEAMRAICAKLPRWNMTDFEIALWQLDQKINDRGMPIDLALVDGALAAIEREQQHLAAEASRLTDGEVTSATRRDQLLAAILTQHGVDMPDMRAATIEKFLERGDVDEGLRELLVVRQQASTSSTAKYKSIRKAVSSTGRVCGTKQFCGASRTGRWAGRTVQPDNFPRPEHSEGEIERGIAALKAGCADMLFDNVMSLTKSAIRGTIAPPAGRKLTVADLSNIEGRGLAWLAGEQWKLQAFREFDAGRGADLYALAYAKSFNVTPEAVMENKKNGDGTMRQVGKVQELALGYAGGIGAFVTFAEAYSINLDELADSVMDTLPGDKILEASDFIEWLSGRPGYRPLPISHRAQVMCEVFKRAWREAHPAIVSWWAELENNTRQAIQNPRHKFHGTNHTAVRTGAWLRLILPSGRSLCYPAPEVDDEGGISYMGVNQYTRKWERIRTYSGKIAENMTQAFARDVLAYNMPAIDEAGYEIILTVHDEIISETPDTPEYNAEHLAAMMSRVPHYAPGLPLAASGFEAYRYRKD